MRASIPRRTLLTVTLAMGLALLLSSVAHSDSITSPDTEDNNGDTSLDDVGQHTSLALDTSGNPVVSYYDVTNGDLKVLHCNDRNCVGGDESIASPDTAGDVGQYTSLALDVSTGNPVISYYRADTANLKVLRCGDANCTSGNSITPPDSGGDVGQYTSLALDISGYPVVSYYDATNGNLKVLHCGNANCTAGNSITAPDQTDDIGQYTSLVLDASGNPVVAYYSVTAGNLKLMHCNDVNCTGDDETINWPDASGDVGLYGSLALDADGYPVASSYRADLTNLRVLHCNDANCAAGDDPLASPDTADDVGQYTSLALDAVGNPVVSYYYATDGDLRVLHCDDPNCEGDESGNITSPDMEDNDNDTVPDDVGQYTSLALDAGYNPVVSYYDVTNGDLKVLRSDADGDGCTAAQEAAMGLDDADVYDFFDVPVPANPDFDPNGSKNKTISMADVAAVIFYYATQDGGGPNGNGVDYDTVKESCDVDADTIPDAEGLCYDRSPGPGLPDGAVLVSDVLTALQQVGLDCGGVAGPAASGGPNAMAVDADPATAGVIDTAATRSVGTPFQLSVDVTGAAAAYQGYDLLLEYDASKLAFVATSDLGGDTVLESWDYTGLGGMPLDVRTIERVDTPVSGSNRLQGGSSALPSPISATGQAVLATFECIAAGNADLHLVTSTDNPAVFSTTLLPGGAPVTTTLADATITCSVLPALQDPTFSVSRSSASAPVPVDPADLLVRSPGGAYPPTVVYPCASLGLAACGGGDDVNGGSLGDDFTLPRPDPANPRAYLYFSVAPGSTGEPGTGVNNETTGCAIAEPESDEFGSAAVGGNYQFMDGDGIASCSNPAAPALGLLEGVSGPDDLDTLDPVNQGGTIFPAYGTLDQASPWLGGWFSAAGIVAGLGGGGAGIYAYAPALGLDSSGLNTDDIDALCIDDADSNGAYGPGDTVWFSLTADSASLAIAGDSAADIFAAPFTPGEPVVTAEQLGLLPSDDLNALKCYQVPPPIVVSVDMEPDTPGVQAATEIDLDTVEGFGDGLADFSVDIFVQNIPPPGLSSFQVDLAYDDSRLDVLFTLESPFLESNGGSPFCVGGAGGSPLSFSCSVTVGYEAQGSGVLATVEFDILPTPGGGPLSFVLDSTSLTDADSLPIPHSTEDGTGDVIGVIETVAGTGEADYYGDGIPAVDAKLHGPRGVFETGTGSSTYFADTENHRVRKIDAAGIITLVAGNGTGDYCGDDGPATSACLNLPHDVFVDGIGDIYIADTDNNVIRRVSAGGTITRVAGRGSGCPANPVPPHDGCLATEATLGGPRGVAVDGSGNIYIADTENHRIRRIDAATGIISTVAGNGTLGFSGDGGAAIDATLNRPHDVYVYGELGDLVIADTDNHRIRRVDGFTGVIDTIAGSGLADYGGDGGLATLAHLNGPEAVAVDSADSRLPNVFIADTQNNRIRRIDGRSAVITTVAGDGTAGEDGDGGPATEAQLNYPSGVAVGSLTVGDTENNTLRAVDPTTGKPSGRFSGFACTVGSISTADWVLVGFVLGLVLARRRIRGLMMQIRLLAGLARRPGMPG